MNPAPPVKSPVRLAADVAKPLALSEPAKALLSPGLAVRAYFEALGSNPTLKEDAIKFLAAALPKREAVWWGLVCVKETIKPPLPEPAVKALTAAEKWVREPSEANRRAAGDAAEVAGRDTAAGCLAAGAFWSGGSMGPANQPAVPPPEHLTALTIAAALALTSGAEPLRADAVRSRYLALGQQVAGGQLKW